MPGREQDHRTMSAPPPANELESQRRKLVAARQALPDRLERSVRLQQILRAWLIGRRERSIGAYWPIKGEFDPLPALWYPGCETELDAYDIPKPKGTDQFLPQLLVVPCLGFGPGGARLGYGGGFFDRTLRALTPKPVTVGVSFTHGFLPFLRSSPDDLPLDALLTEDGVMWQRP
jgi:5-formyltetrahydrofolate cyclo-ligase